METHETFYGNKSMNFLFETEFMGFSGISFDDFSIFWKFDVLLKKKIDFFIEFQFEIS